MTSTDPKLTNCYDRYICVDNKVGTSRRSILFNFITFISNLDIAHSTSNQFSTFDSLTVVLFPRVH